MPVQCGWLLTIANLGDSRAVLDTGAQILQLSVDHRVATHRAERHRLERTGALIAPIDVSGEPPSRPIAWPSSAHQAWITHMISPCLLLQPGRALEGPTSTYDRCQGCTGVEVAPSSAALLSRTLCMQARDRQPGPMRRGGGRLGSGRAACACPGHSATLTWGRLSLPFLTSCR